MADQPAENLTASRRPTFGLNSEVREEYGQVLEALTPRLSVYQAILVASEREFKALNEIAPKGAVPIDRLRDAMKQMYPDQPVDTLFKTNADLALCL